MTDEEDARNAELNEAILACHHKLARADIHGRIRCPQCQAQFCIVLLPRRAKPHIHLEEDFE